MSHLEIEIKSLKSDVLEMFSLVKVQLEKSKEAMLTLDKDLAREVLITEKRVNSFELKIDRDCENIIALLSPLAIDLRFVLACLKINSNLERIGDISEGICQFVLNIKLAPKQELIDSTRFMEMFETSISILEDVKTAFETEDTKLARSVFQKDEILDEINIAANEAVSNFIRENQDRINQSLYLLSAIRKLERVGDQCKNISEEIIFYIEARVLKHKSREQKQKE